jgi:cytochrome c biogenesis protein CcmG, thiol:disulfide interchange protein DsbE
MESNTTDVVIPAAKAKSRPKWGRLAIWTGLILLLVIVGLMLAKRQQGPIKVGSPVPDFSLTDFEGKSYKLSDLKGKVVLVNFWASWCKPCEQEAADLEQAWRHYQPNSDVLFLGVDWTDTEPNAKAYLAKFDITYPNGPDLGTRISQSYRTTGVPETYIIDQDGNLAYVKLSPFQSLAEIQSAIDRLLEK